MYLREMADTQIYRKIGTETLSSQKFPWKQCSVPTNTRELKRVNVSTNKKNLTLNILKLLGN